MALTVEEYPPNRSVLAGSERLLCLARFGQIVLEMMVEGEIGDFEGFEEMVTMAKENHLIQWDDSGYFTYAK